MATSASSAVLNTRYPTFYTFKLMQYFAQPGDTVLNATSDYSLLSTYASRKADGALALLVINKDNATTFNAQIYADKFQPVDQRPRAFLRHRAGRGHAHQRPAPPRRTSPPTRWP